MVIVLGAREKHVGNQVRGKPEDELLRDMKVLHSMIDGGLRSAVLERRFNFFACEQCLAKLHDDQIVSPDTFRLEMARNQALYFWRTETREKVMRPDEFPYPFGAFDFPFNERLAGVVNNIMARETTQAGKIAVYTNAMARHLQFQQRSSSGTWRKLSGRPYVAVTADLAFGDVTGTFLDGFIERWLLKDVGKDTTVYCSHYDLPRWFSFRVAPLLAVGIVLNTAGKESDSVETKQGPSWNCYVNTNGGHCMVVLGSICPGNDSRAPTTV